MYKVSNQGPSVKLWHGILLCSAAVTKSHGPGALDNRNFFLVVGEAGKSKIKVQASLVLWVPLLQPSCCVLALLGERERESSLMSPS